MQIARRSRQAGVTLIECCVAATIASALLGVAVPSFKQTIERRALEGAADQVATDVLYARSEAVARNRNISIGFGTTAAGSCYVIHSGAPGDCTCGADGPAVCSDGATELKTVFLPAGGAVQVRANVQSMRFSSIYGTTTPGGTVRVVANSGLEIRQVVNMMGRPQACSPSGRISRYRTCA